MIKKCLFPLGCYQEDVQLKHIGCFSLVLKEIFTNAKEDEPGKCFEPKGYGSLDYDM